MDNVSYTRTSYLMSGDYKGFELIQPVNAVDPSYVYGGELEVQANLTLLPGKRLLKSSCSRVISDSPIE